uniref:t-SNARE coiled-coil homology domain-containing protein n=1 Tax=Ciona savignyi TaxID=51511 RepID=H2YEB9_CIOSA
MESSADARNYTRLTQLVSSNLQKIFKNGQELKNLLSRLGADNDSGELLIELNKRQHHTKDLLEKTADHLTKVKSIPAPESSSEKRERNKMTTRLTKDLKEVSTTFQETQREIAKIEKNSIAKMRSQSESNSEKQPFLNAQGGMQMQQMAAHDLAALQERELELQKLESDIVDVNIIFNDLGKMVEDQGEMIDSIEAHVDNAQDKVVKGKSELEQAEENQKKSRKKKLICGVILIVLIIIVILIIYFSIPK